MKTKNLSLSKILGYTCLLFCLYSMKSFASADLTIECETAYGEKKVQISQERVAFLKEDIKGADRSLSSIKEHQVSTRHTHKGFKKTLFVDGNKHIININNTEKFDEVNDYLAITSPKGHTMTYPLNCQQI